LAKKNKCAGPNKTIQGGKLGKINKRTIVLYTQALFLAVSKKLKAEKTQGFKKTQANFAKNSRISQL